MPELDNPTTEGEGAKPTPPTLSELIGLLAQDIAGAIAGGCDADTIRAEVSAYDTLVRLQMDGAR